MLPVYGSGMSVGQGVIWYNLIPTSLSLWGHFFWGGSVFVCLSSRGTEPHVALRAEPDCACVCVSLVWLETKAGYSIGALSRVVTV